MLEKNDIAKFWNEGALLARDVLSEGETILLRHKIEGFIATWESQGLAQRTLTGGRLAVDLLSVPVLRNLFSYYLCCTFNSWNSTSLFW